MKLWTKYLVSGINAVLSIAIIATATQVNVTTGYSVIENQQKEINRGDFVYLSTKRMMETVASQEEVIEVQEVELEEADATSQAEMAITQDQIGVPNGEEKPAVQGTASMEEKVLETFTGKVSGYGPDCQGCSGNTSSGFNIYQNGIYYHDAVYGMVRIVAGDPKYDFGTIVRMTNTRFSSEPILAIVLDRGSAIGIGRAYDFDLLYESESATEGISKNVTFEILRLGF